MLIKTMSCSVSWCRWVTMQRKSMTSESWLRGDITPTGHHSMVTPVPVSRGVSVNSAHLATFWKLLKSSQRSWQNWPKSVKKKSKHMAKLSKSRQQWAVMALGRSWWCHRKEGMRNASGCVPLWSLAPAGEEEERGLASAKHCQASIENTISYPLPSHTPATTASSSSVQIWRKIKFWILNSDLHVHFASDVRLCILSEMSECIMTPSILLE